MAIDPESMSDPAKLRSLLQNALRLKERELALRCQVQLAKLESSKYQDPVEQDFWKAVAVAEELATERNGRTTRLSRTRQKEGRVGFRQCLIDWALDPSTTDGFKILVEHGYAELTGEAIVVKHAPSFPDDVVAAAKTKLEEHGVDTHAIYSLKS